ncbi:MAG: pitrilysin family protein [Candidatus Omnitrophota bacterium]|nr:pitrilysin family protein [Candidatus Omnitrophota bacterium]
MYRKTILGNGLRIITHPMKRMQSAALGIWIKVGGRYETSEYKGIAHFLEHLLFKGSKKYSYRKIKESIEGVGGSLNGFTSEELTCYLAKLPYSHLGLALDVLSDMVINPLLHPEEIEKERTVILEEEKMYKDLPQSYVYELLDELLWPNQPIGMTIIGTVESIGRIYKENLSLFKSQYYIPSNIVVSAAGLLEHDKFTNRIRNIFSSLRSKDVSVSPFLKVEEECHRPQLKLLHKDTEQTHLALGFHSFKRDHPLRYAQGLLHIILGANMSSRLFNELREKKGLAYEIGTQVKYFQDTGAFIVHAGIDNRKVNASIEVILKELEKAKDKLVSIDEFKRAKEFYLGQLALSLEETLDNMLWIGESTATLDEVYSLKDIVKKINKIRREDIREVADYIFKENSLNLALIGPLKDSEQVIYEQLRLT